ncbi:unnamed protein product [Sphagnum troendelagicum]|uniref:Secreted protein n=1 Tax=Sphagnum troendelagicum TaxID=128251 RepID=A0ABP0TUM5_9BRYO
MVVMSSPPMPSEPISVISSKIVVVVLAAAAAAATPAGLSMKETTRGAAAIQETWFPKNSSRWYPTEIPNCFNPTTHARLQEPETPHKSMAVPDLSQVISASNRSRSSSSSSSTQH